MRDDKRRARGAAPAAIEAATVALEGKTYTVTPAAIEAHGVIAGEITDMQVAQ